MNIITRLKLFALFFLFTNILIAQEMNPAKSDWLSFEKKMIHFSGLTNVGFEKYRSEKKDDWKRAFVFEETLELFENTTFLYGYNNAKQEYIECTINEFNHRTGVIDLDQTDEDLLKIEHILKSILDKNYKRYESSSVRKECVFCSDSTLILWKNIAEDGSKFLEKKYVTLEYFKTYSQVNITFYNNRRIIDGFFEKKEKKENVPEQVVIDLKEDDSSKETDAWAVDTKASAAYQFLHHYLLLMKTEKSDSPNLKSKISPSFISTNQLNNKDFLMNGFSGYGGFKIMEQSGSKITVFIWAKNLFWTHKVTFDVIQENGIFYINPLDVNADNYVTTWSEVERYVKVKFVK